MTNSSIDIRAKEILEALPKDVDGDPLIAIKIKDTPLLWVDDMQEALCNQKIANSNYGVSRGLLHRICRRIAADEYTNGAKYPDDKLPGLVEERLTKIRVADKMFGEQAYGAGRA